jgi:hypothetical protein
MSKTRSPVRLLDYSDKSQALPKELLANFTTGILYLVNASNQEVAVPLVKSALELKNGDTIIGTYNPTDGTKKSLNLASVFLPLAGGTLTGAVTGTEFSASKFKVPTPTTLSTAATKFAVFDDNGYINYRTKANMMSDLGAAALASPTFTGTPKAPTAASGTNTTQLATTAFVQNALAGLNALVFKGSIGTGGDVTALPASHNVGDTYVVSTAGTYAGQVCEVGDMIICKKAGTTAANADWTIVQANLDGVVLGPASSSDLNIAVFDGATGKKLKDSGFTIGKSVPSDAVFTDTVYTHPSFTGITQTEEALTPSYGESFTINTVEVNSNGHVTKVTPKKITLPAAPTSVDHATSADSATTANSATTATKAGQLATARKITLTGGATGNVSFDGSADTSMAVTLNAVKEYTTTIGTSWSGSSAPYTQNVSVPGILATDTPIVDVKCSGTYSTDQTYITQWGKIYRITTYANGITVYATEKTTSNVPISIKCIRNS